MPHRPKSWFIPYSHTSLAFYLKSNSDDSKKNFRTLELQVRVNLSILGTEELVHHKRFLHFYSVVIETHTVRTSDFSSSLLRTDSKAHANPRTAVVGLGQGFSPGFHFILLNPFLISNKKVTQTCDWGEVFFTLTTRGGTGARAPQCRAPHLLLPESWWAVTVRL